VIGYAVKEAMLHVASADGKEQNLTISGITKEGEINIAYYFS
jgi:hypothetical protein